MFVEIRRLFIDYEIVRMQKKRNTRDHIHYPTSIDRFAVAEKFYHKITK